ncbi:MAG: hypothetical protein B7Z10_12225 [Rhodobacterales bacterium 32-66-7]|nr:MAG: hypothetical protein B7Z10_12225 [Rhodobacterales bacterium 32-66-7]
MDEETRKRFDALDAVVGKVGATTEKLGVTVERLTDVVSAKFDQIDVDLGAIVQRLDRQDLQLEAILIRLEDADTSHDRLMGKVDRLGVLARAGEEAMTSLDALAKRVAKLEAARRGEN